MPVEAVSSRAAVPAGRAGGCEQLVDGPREGQIGAEFELSRLLLTFRRAARGGSEGPLHPRRIYHPPNRARCTQPRRVAVFECTMCVHGWVRSVMGEVEARTVVSFEPRSFVG